MRRAAHVVVLSWIACACAETDVAPPPADVAPAALRVATWNVHDLFDEVDRVTVPGELDTVPSAAEVERKLTLVAAVLARIDADVLVLEEVENEALLARLAARLASGSFRTFLREGRDPRGIDVGVLARVPFRPGPSHLGERAADGSWLWARDVLELAVDVGGRPLSVLGAHLVSRLDAAEAPRRLEQARRLRGLADALRCCGAEPPSVLVLGDLNDLPDSPPLQALMGGGGLVDLGAALPPAQAWTWSGGGARERLDYALLGSDGGVAVSRVRVESGPDVAEASDHRPVVVDLWPGVR